MRPLEDQETPSHPSLAAMKGQWLFYLIAGIGILFSFFLWYIFLLQDTANLTQLVQVQTNHLSEDVELQLGLRISALKHMAKHLYDGKGDALDNWQDISEYTEDYGGFSGLVWFDGNYKVQHGIAFHDKASFSKMLQLYVIDKANQIKVSSRDEVWLSPAFDLPKTGKSIFIVLTFKDNRGYLAALMNFENAFAIHLNVNEYGLQLFYDNQKIFQNGSFTPGSQSSKSVMDLYGMNWTTIVQPSKQLIREIRTTLPFVALVAGIIIALLFAIASYLAQLARTRAHSLDAINKDLKKEIIERVEAESQKQRLEKGLLQGQKLQAIGTLAGGIAHDFNNLLYAIIGYVEMAQEDIQKDSLTYQNLGKVLEASRRGQDLIARILSFSRRHHHELQPMNLLQCIDSVLELLVPTIPASVSIDFVNELPNDFIALADSTRLHQVIVNIVNNAVDAMDGEGVITLKLSLVKKDDVLLKQFAELPAVNYCRIDISDTGHGMEQSTIERIFEPFFTTKEVGKGTGLGLATVHTIVKEHNGDIVVSSQLGHGTRFSILIPEYQNQKPKG